MHNFPDNCKFGYHKQTEYSLSSLLNEFTIMMPPNYFIPKSFKLPDDLPSDYISWYNCHWFQTLEIHFQVEVKLNTPLHSAESPGNLNHFSEFTRWGLTDRVRNLGLKQQSADY